MVTLNKVVLQKSEILALRSRFQTAELDWSPGLERDFAVFKAELIRWNQKVNLVSRSDEGRVVDAHVIDSLRILPFIRRDGGEVRLLDIGTGAGFPGLVLKIARPDLAVVLVDSARKKRLFLMHMISTLELTGIDVLDRRAEEIADVEQLRGRFHVVTSRAVGSLAVTIPLAAPFLAPGGRFITFKPSVCGSEMEEAAGVCASVGLSKPVVLDEDGNLPRRGSLVQVTCAVDRQTGLMGPTEGEMNS